MIGAARAALVDVLRRVLREAKAIWMAKPNDPVWVEGLLASKPPPARAV